MGPRMTCPGSCKTHGNHGIRPQITDIKRYRSVLLSAYTPTVSHPLATHFINTSSIMTGAEGLTIGAAAIRRRELTGKTGMSALMENKKAFFIAVFASFVFFFHEQRSQPAYASPASEVYSMATNRVYSDKRLSCQLFEPNSLRSILQRVLPDG
jgi:hypothetical protein